MIERPGTSPWARGASILNVEQGDATTGGPCIRVPGVVLALWDRHFTTNPGVVTNAMQPVTGPMTGAFMNEAAGLGREGGKNMDAASTLGGRADEQSI